MRPRTLLVLFALVAAMAAFIWFFERDLPSSEERREQSGRLVSLEVEAVGELELRAGESVVRLRRSEEAFGGEAEWSLIEPPLGLADADEVGALLDQIAKLDKERTLEDGSPEALGLSSPRAEIVIGVGAGSTVVKIGSPIPASDNTIAEVGTGPPFYVVEDSLFEEVTRDAHDWRSRDALPIDRSAISELAIETSAGVATLTRVDSLFRLSSPVEDEADEDRVSSLLGELDTLEVEDFLDDPGAAPELENPAATLRLAVEGRAEPLEVVVASASALGGDTDSSEAAGGDPMTVMRVGGRTFQARTDIVEQLTTPPSRWRSPKWASVRTFEIERAAVSGAGGEFELEREDGEWRRDGEAIAYTAADGFLRAVTGATGQPGDAAPAPDAAPALDVRIGTADGEERLRLFDLGGSYLALREGRDATLVLEPDAAAEVFSKLDELRTAEVEAEPVPADEEP